MTNFSELPADPFADETSVTHPVLDSFSELLAAAVDHRDDTPPAVLEALTHHTAFLMTHLASPNTYVLRTEHLRTAVAALSAFAYGHDNDDYDVLADLVHRTVAEDTVEDLNLLVSALCAVAFTVAATDTDDYLERLRRLAATIG